MRKYVSCLACLILSFAVIQQANGQVLLSITNEVDNAGESVDVIISIADPSGSELTNFNIPIDFGSDNAFTSVPGVINFTPDSETGLSSFSNLELTSFPPGNFDVALADSGGAITLSSTPTDLFSLSFAIDPSAAPGSLLPVSIQTTPEVGGSPFPGLLTLTLDGTPIESDATVFDDVEIASGSVAVPGVPEPGSATLMMVAFSGLALCRRRAR